MNNADAIIYTKKLIAELTDEGLFNPEEDVFLDEQFLYPEILKLSKHNLATYGDPLISEEQLVFAITEARNASIAETMESLIAKGLAKFSGINADGEVTYTKTEDGNKYL